MLGTARLTAFLATTDAGRARAFYGGVLGLPLLADDQFALTFDSNGTELRIQKVPAVQPLPFTALGWQVPRIHAMVAALSEAGVTFERYSFMQQDVAGVWEAPRGTEGGGVQGPHGQPLSPAEPG